MTSASINILQNQDGTVQHYTAMSFYRFRGEMMWFTQKQQGNQSFETWNQHKNPTVVFGNGKGKKKKGWNIFFRLRTYVRKDRLLRSKAGSKSRRETEPEGPPLLTQPETSRQQRAAVYWLLWGCVSADGKGKQSFPKVTDSREHSNQRCSNHSEKH